MTFEDVRQEVAALVEHELAPVTALARAYEETISPDRIGHLDEDEIAATVAALSEEFAATEALVGLGFAAGPSAMVAGVNCLFWLLKSAHGVRRLALNLQPGDPDQYDYHSSEWFSGAETLGTPSIYGPYLDYSGAGLLVHTAAVPISIGGTFVGVAGGDLLADTVELRLTRLLRGIDGDAVVVTRDRVVIAATGSRWLPGERLSAQPTPGRWSSVAPVGDWTGWTIAAGPAS
jgi:hypothetical protein